MRFQVVCGAVYLELTPVLRRSHCAELSPLLKPLTAKLALSALKTTLYFMWEIRCVLLAVRADTWEILLKPVVALRKYRERWLAYMEEERLPPRVGLVSCARCVPSFCLQQESLTMKDYATHMPHYFFEFYYPPWRNYQRKFLVRTLVKIIMSRWNSSLSATYQYGPLRYQIFVPLQYFFARLAYPGRKRKPHFRRSRRVVVLHLMFYNRHWYP